MWPLRSRRGGEKVVIGQKAKWNSGGECYPVWLSSDQQMFGSDLCAGDDWRWKRATGRIAQRHAA
jgi:hypothetical protein